MTEPDDVERCGVTWADGWGEHTCTGYAGHAGSHGCRCDAVLRRTDDELIELELDRLDDERADLELDDDERKP